MNVILCYLGYQLELAENNHSNVYSVTGFQQRPRTSQGHNKTWLLYLASLDHQTLEKQETKPILQQPLNDK